MRSPRSPRSARAPASTGVIVRAAGAFPAAYVRQLPSFAVRAPGTGFEVMNGVSGTPVGRGTGVAAIATGGGGVAIGADGIGTAGIGTAGIGVATGLGVAANASAGGGVADGFGMVGGLPA